MTFKDFKTKFLDSSLILKSLLYTNSVSQRHQELSGIIKLHFCNMNIMNTVSICKQVPSCGL